MTDLRPGGRSLSPRAIQLWLAARPWLVVSALYVLATIFFTYPTILHLNSALAGEDSSVNPASDVFETTWSIWWWQHAIFDLHQSPIQLSVLNHPLGETYPLYWLMAQSFIFAAPAARLLSVVFAYNLMTMAGFVLCGLAGYALCLEVTGNRLASFVGGFIWAFFPLKTAHALGGHLFNTFLFSLPLAALCLLRLLRAPSWRSALLAAGSLLLASTIHPMYLAFTVAPLVAALLLFSLLEGRAAWGRKKALAVGLAFGLAALAVAVLLWPTLAQLQQENEAYAGRSADIDHSGVDLLAYFVPPATNPFLRSTPLAAWARHIELPYEKVVYAGWVPLLLAVVGAGAGRLKGRPWMALALGGGLFSLGPLLQINGHLATLVFSGRANPIVMPYALLTDLPFLRWNGQPARLSVVVMLAVSVLAALGAARLWQSPRLRRHALALTGLIVLVTGVEYLVTFPFPMRSAAVPAPVQTLAAIPDGRAVLQVPALEYPANQRALYWQTTHQHPIVGGRVYHDLPDVVQQADFYSRVLLGPEGSPAIYEPTGAQRLAVLNDAGVGWVLYDLAADPQRQLQPLIEALLGPPLSQDEAGALYRVPASAWQPAQPLWAISSFWGTVGGKKYFCGTGLIHVYAPLAASGYLTFRAEPTADLRRIGVSLNRQPAGQLFVGDALTYQSPPVTLRRGYNELLFVDQGIWPQTSAGSSQAGSSSSSDCTVLGPDFSKLQFMPGQPPPAPAPAVFGSAVQLQDYAFPAQAHPGGVVTVHLVWQSLQPAGEDFTLFLHLLSGAGQLAAQRDEVLLGSVYPTSQWQPGETVATALSLPLPASLPSGSYRLQLGLYRYPSLDRLEISGREAADNVLDLGPLTVNP
jgi:hypothetical protein